MEQSKFYQIKNITEQEYTLVGCDGSVITRPILDVDKSASAFTIEDAKDGDVLICKGNIKNSNGIKYERICLFNNLNNAFFTLTKTSNFVEEYDIYVNIDYPDNTVPATKEQKEILFMAMADAGYTFDFEKKELKLLITNGGDFETENCEQKPAWSEKDELSCFESDLLTAFSDAWQSYLLGEEVNIPQWAKEHSKELLESAKEELKGHNSAWNGEDNKNLEKTIWYVEKGGKLIFAKTDELVSWLKSLKDRVQPQPKQEWSGVDKDILFRTINDLKFLRDTISIDPKYAVNIIDMEREITWLKSLRPQNKWKPSSEQIKVCKEVYADILSAKGFDLGTVVSELNRLEEGLKKKGE